MPNEQPKECGLLKLIDTVRRCSDAGERFCFVLGAGASVSSGIASGATMAGLWLADLKKFEPEPTQKWIEKNKVDESDIGKYYSALYEKRFGAYPIDGYIWLQNAMKDASPGLGYYHLANILAQDNTPVNLVVTTNFDSLTEDAIFMYTRKKPMVVTHELLAHYMDFLANRPIIAKIHRDLMLRPKSAEDETARLAEAWEPVLGRALNLYSPIVIGYGGNDGSLMGLLKTVVAEHGKEKPIYWCHRRDEPPKSEDIKALLHACGGFLVPIDEFDTTMYLFGVEFGHKFSGESIVNDAKARVERYENKRNEINAHLKAAEERRDLSDTEQAVASAILEEQKNELDRLTKMIEKDQKNAQLYNERGNFYHELKEYEKAVVDYTTAIGLNPYIPNYYNNRGQCLLKKAKRDQLACGPEVIKDFNKALEPGMNSAYAFFFRTCRAAYYLYTGELDKAYDDLQKSYHLHDGHRRTWFYLAKYHEAKGNMEEYERCLNKATETGFTPTDDD